MGIAPLPLPVAWLPPKPDFLNPVALVYGLPYSIPSKRILASIRTENRNAIKGYLLQGGTYKEKAERMHTSARGKAQKSDPLGRFILRPGIL